MKQPTQPITSTVSSGDEEQVILSLHEACKEGDLNLVKKMLADGDDHELVNETDEDDWAPLHHAIHGGNVELVQYLVNEQGADLGVITSGDEEGQEALCFAITDGHLDVVKYLAENGGEDMMDTANNGELTPLHLATADGHFNIVQYLVEEHQVDAEATDDDDWTPLHYASLAGDLQSVRFLSEKHHVDCDAVEVDGWSPLLCAANKGHVDVVKYLLEEQQVDSETLVANVQQNALHLAAAEGRLETVRYLVEEYGFDVNETASNQYTAFLLAARYGMLDVIKYLVEQQSAEDRLDLLLSTNAHGSTAHDIVVERVEDEDEYANQDLVDYLYSYVAPLSVSASEDDDVCVKMNPRLSEQDMELAQECMKRVEETEAYEVAHHILGFLCLSDIKQ